MFVHTVLLQPRPEATEAQLAGLTTRLQDLANAVVGPGSYAMGPNVTEEPLDQGYQFGFVLRFANRGALDAYHVNPAHLAVSLAIRDLAATVLVFDLEA
jgi:hypothetical protein